MLSLCAALMMLAACCLLAPGTDRDSAAPAPLVFRWRKGWLPLGLTLLFACRACGPAVGVVTWFGLLAPAGVLTALFMACAPEAARDWLRSRALALSDLLFFPAVLAGSL